jgi:hypothetical protein
VAAVHGGGELGTTGSEAGARGACETTWCCARARRRSAARGEDIKLHLARDERGRVEQYVCGGPCGTRGGARP